MKVELFPFQNLSNLQMIEKIKNFQKNLLQQDQKSKVGMTTIKDFWQVWPLEWLQGYLSSWQWLALHYIGNKVSFL